MEQLISRLNLMKDSYYEFVDSVADYAEKSREHYELIMHFLDDNQFATPSDVIKYISFQPDFFADSAPTDEGALVG